MIDAEAERAAVHLQLTVLLCSPRRSAYESKADYVQALQNVLAKQRAGQLARVEP